MLQTERKPAHPGFGPTAGPGASWGFSEGDEIAPGRHAVRLLGGGTTYEAYLAWDDDLLALVVAKILRPDRVEYEASLAAIAAEAAMLDALSHPVLLRSFGATLTGPRPHLVLEYLDGPRLSTLLRTSVIALEQVLELGLQLASAVHYMHTRDVVHLDVKPRNIIMAGPARLVDLSVAQRLGQLAGISGPIGTTAYMAPEQTDPRFFPELGPRADVWGIGVTLYHALAKSSPFPVPRWESDAPLEERYPQIIHEPAPLPRSVPGPVAELIELTLAPRPSDRPTAAQLAAELEPIVACLPRPRLGRLRPGGKPKNVLSAASSLSNEARVSLH
jgi:serine/threonine protein kinase